MKLKDMLEEGISPIVYHSTEFNNLKKILKSNTFRLVTDFGTQAEVGMRGKKDKYYYLSTTRHKLGGYSLEPYHKAVMLVLDGKKLGNTYGGKAVDYWGPAFRKIDPKKAEAEDRIYNTKPIIPNAKKYIKEIHVLYETDRADTANRQSYDRKAFIEMKKSGIPIWIYDDRKNYLIQNKAKSVKLDLEYVSAINKEKPLIYNDLGNKYNDVEPWIELYHKTKKSSLSKKARDRLYNLRSYAQDAVTNLSNAIHNDKKSDNKVNRQINSLIKIMRKEKLRSVKDFIIMIQDKWYPVTEEVELMELFNSKADTWKKLPSLFGNKVEKFGTIVGDTYVEVQIYPSKKGYGERGKRIVGKMINIEFKTYQGKFIEEGKDIWDYDDATLYKLSVNGTMQITGGGNAIKILSVTINLLKDWILKNKPLKITFSGAKGGGRVAVYAKLSKMAHKKLSNYTFTDMDDQWDEDTYYTLYRNDVVKYMGIKITGFDKKTGKPEREKSAWQKIMAGKK